MRLLRIPEPFNHPDWLYEVKFDGFRALTHVTGHHCQLISRNGHGFKSWPYLAEETRTRSVRTARCSMARSSALTLTAAAGFAICCSADWPYFLAFDVLSIDGEIYAPCRSSSVSVGSRASCRVSNRGCYCWMRFLPAVSVLFVLACERDLERIVAKWAPGTYQCDGRATSWLKIKNPDYSQMEGRQERFAAKRAEWRPHRTKAASPTLALR